LSWALLDELDEYRVALTAAMARTADGDVDLPGAP
jgi:hypothetical protein